MSEVQIYHNPRCTKSRETLALLQEKGIEPEIILYLDSPPDAATLQALLAMLGFSSARDLMRKKEEIYKTLALEDKTLSEAQLLQAMAENPKLIERPIVISKGKARLGRPPEQVLTIL
jgi:arsenate reductase